MTTRAEYLVWCKQRAKEYADKGDSAGALASMTSDLRKWSGGEIYDGQTLMLLTMDAMLFRKTPADMNNWIDGFN